MPRTQTQIVDWTPTNLSAMEDRDFIVPLKEHQYVRDLSSTKDKRVYGPGVVVFRTGGGMVEQIELAELPEAYILVPPNADAKSIGTVYAREDGWALVKPADASTRQQALSLGATTLLIK